VDESTRDKVCGSIVPKCELPSDCVTFRLPNAPSLRYYCVYGHGKETEVSIQLAEMLGSDATASRGHTGEQELIAVLVAVG